MTEEQTKEQLEKYYKARENENKKTFMNHYVFKPILVNSVHYMHQCVKDYNIANFDEEMFKFHEAGHAVIRTMRCTPDVLMTLGKAFTVACVIMQRDDTYKIAFVKICEAITKIKSVPS